MAASRGAAQALRKRGAGGASCCRALDWWWLGRGLVAGRWSTVLATPGVVRSVAVQCVRCPGPGKVIDAHDALGGGGRACPCIWLYLYSPMCCLGVGGVKQRAVCTRGLLAPSCTVSSRGCWNQGEPQRSQGGGSLRVSLCSVGCDDGRLYVLSAWLLAECAGGGCAAETEAGRSGVDGAGRPGSAAVRWGLLPPQHRPGVGPRERAGTAQVCAMQTSHFFSSYNLQAGGKMSGHSRFDCRMSQPRTPGVASRAARVHATVRHVAGPHRCACAAAPWGGPPLRAP
jgi:hypothetical protein